MIQSDTISLKMRLLFAALFRWLVPPSSPTSTRLAHETFDTVIIDEATQTTEVSSLIPLKFNCKRLILSGDPQQLPAVCFSKMCEKLEYSRSMFVRFQLNKYPVHMLKEQYRMHPQISSLISSTFYDGKVTDSEVIQKRGQHEKAFSFLKPFYPIAFIHIEVK